MTVPISVQTNRLRILSNKRMTKFLGTKRSGAIVKIFKLPTNAELSKSSAIHIYDTKKFPEWRLCLNPTHGKEGILHLGETCRICNDTSLDWSSPIRFVAACEDGHLDDINWDYFIHSNKKCDEKVSAGSSEPRIFHWIRSGGALGDTEVRCPNCNVSKKLIELFYRDWSCSGRHPQNEYATQYDRTLRCNKQAKVIQKQASNLRIPETVTLLSIQPVYTKLHNLVENPQIESVIKLIRQYEKNDITKDRFINGLTASEIPDTSIREFRNSSWDEIKEVFRFMDIEIPDSYHYMILNEFKELVNASKNGAPPSRYKNISRPKFEVVKHDIKKFKISDNGLFTVVPISALETITTQTGFRRVVSKAKNESKQQAKLVGIGFKDENNTLWYPSISFMGEGIFILMNNDWVNNIKGTAVEKWRSSYNDNGAYEEFVFRDAQNSRDELHPGFVWWHTLSHLLIRSISEDAGYSTASIRERVYFKQAGKNSQGGLLLYATQPGTDGTLGGLTALVPEFKIFLERAFNLSETCSADPLCSQQTFEHTDVNGACCYGCLMNSETSCEHRNMWLDRAVLKENRP